MHTNLSSVLRVIIRDLQISKTTILPVVHISFRKLSRNLQSEANTCYSRELPGSIKDSLFLCTLQTAFPTMGKINLEEMVQILSLNLAEVINDTTSALGSQ